MTGSTSSIEKISITLLGVTDDCREA